MKIDLFTITSFYKNNKDNFVDSKKISDMLHCGPDDWCWPQSGTPCGPGPEGCWPTQCTPQRGPCYPCSPSD